MFVPCFAYMDTRIMRIAILTLIASSIQTGCLSLPLVLKYSGLFLGSFILIISAFAAYISMNSISLAAERRNIFNYPKLVNDLLGKVNFTIESFDISRHNPHTLFIFISSWIRASMQRINNQFVKLLQF